MLNHIRSHLINREKSELGTVDKVDKPYRGSIEKTNSNSVLGIVPSFKV